MMPLRPCRWRDARGKEWQCRSARYVAPPNHVTADFCQQCCYCDHAPVAALPWDFVTPGALTATIAVGTLYTPEIAAYATLTAGVLADYARRHGYTAVIAPRVLDLARPAAWSKLVLTEGFLAANPDCRWFLWVDADALITNPAQRIEDLLDADVDFIVAEDVAPSPINTGVFLARNCAAVREFIRRAYAKVQYLHHPWWEQLAVAEALRESGHALRARIVSRQLFNSFPGEHCPGNFVMHFAGWSYRDKVAGLRGAAQRYCHAGQNAAV